MSYDHPMQYGRPVEDLDKWIFGASRITQGLNGACVPPIPREEPSPFNRRHNGHGVMGRGQIIMEQEKVCNVGFRDQRISQDIRRVNGLSLIGRGQMIIEQEKRCNVGFRDQRISQDIRRSVPGARGYSNTAIQEIITSTGQFESDLDIDVEEPYFIRKKITSTPSSSENKSAAHRDPSSPSPGACGGLDVSVPPQDPVGLECISDTDTALDRTNASESLPDVSASTLELSTTLPETSLDQSDVVYLDPFYYKFDDSMYIKADIPVAPAIEAPTPSPCSSPLPNHSTIDGKYVGCVQVESDSSSSTSLVFDSDLAEISASQNASDFSTRLRSVLPDHYNEVMTIWHDYQADQLTSSVLEQQISRLLGPYPDLLDAFFKFASLSSSDEPESYSGEPFSAPNESMSRVLDVQDEHLQKPSNDDHTSIVLDDQPPEVLEDPINQILNVPMNTVASKIRAEKFVEYIKFCRLVRFELPNVFDELRALLNNCVEEIVDKKSMIESAFHLFRFHPELVEDFKKLTNSNFCPTLIQTAGSLVAKSDLQKVARLSSSSRPRRCRNALILKLLKKDTSKQDPALGDNLVEPIPARLEDDVRYTGNRVEGMDIGDNVCGEYVKRDTGKLSGVANFGVPIHTSLGCSGASAVTLAVLDNTIARNDEVRPLEDCDTVQRPAKSLCDLVAVESNLEVSKLEEVDSIPDDVRVVSASTSVDESVQDKPLELLKPEDIAPDMTAEIPFSKLEIAQEIVSSVMDSAFQCTTDGLKEALVENEGHAKAEVELLKPSDFVNLETSSAIVEETIDVPEESTVISAVATASDSLENLIREQRQAEYAELCFGEESNSVVTTSSSADLPNSTDALEMPKETNPSSATKLIINSDPDLCHVDSICDSIPVGVEITPADDVDKKLASVVIALSKIDLNFDSVDVETESSGLELKSSSDIVPVTALHLPVSSDDKSQEILAEVEMTVQTIQSDPQTSSLSDASCTPDPSQVNLEGPLLLRPDQFVTLSTAVDPIQVHQALQIHGQDPTSHD